MSCGGQVKLVGPVDNDGDKEGVWRELGNPGEPGTMEVQRSTSFK